MGRNRTVTNRAVTGAVAIFLFLSLPLRAGGGPENVLLIVNADSWASVTVANEYAHLRQIPSSHVLQLRDIPALDYIAVEDFRDLILRPILNAISDRDLEQQIDCIAYSTDFPCGVWTKSEFPWGEMEQHFSDMGSLTGMTYLYETALTGNVREYAALDNNHYVRHPVQWTPKISKSVVPPENLISLLTVCLISRLCPRVHRLLLDICILPIRWNVWSAPMMTGKMITGHEILT